MTAEVDANELRDAVERLHGCPAQLVEAGVSECFEGRLVWHGIVYVFDLAGHRSADRCYAWSSRVEGSDRRRFFAVLHMPPIASPADAVRATILQGPSPDRDGDQISTWRRLLAPAAGKRPHDPSSRVSIQTRIRRWQCCGIARGIQVPESK
jgi:hypothetical protein